MCIHNVYHIVVYSKKYNHSMVISFTEILEKFLFIMLPMRLQNKGRVWIPLKKMKMHYVVTKERMRASTALLSSPTTFILYLIDKYFFRHGILQVSMAGTGHLLSMITVLISEGFSLGSTPVSVFRFDPIVLLTSAAATHARVLTSMAALKRTPA